MAASGSTLAARIAGLPVLKGLILYGATLSFAGFYAYFMEEIATAKSGTPPSLSGVLIGAAAAIAGVLGSGFALAIGVPTTPGQTNHGLVALRAADPVNSVKTTSFRVRRLFSYEAAGTDLSSWPLTFGVWAYAVVAVAVALVFFIWPDQTPAEIKALALGFAGYVITFLHSAYSNATS
jgi:hypothetical protein